MGLKNRIPFRDPLSSADKPSRSPVGLASVGRRAAKESTSVPGCSVCGWREELRGRGRIPCRIGAIPEAGALPVSPTPQGTVLVSQRVSLK